MAKQLSLPSLSLKVGLEQFSIPFLEIECFGELHIQLEDPHGLHIKLVERIEVNGISETFHLKLLLKDLVG
jgi:hypothetical protein